MGECSLSVSIIILLSRITRALAVFFGNMEISWTRNIMSTQQAASILTESLTSVPTVNKLPTVNRDNFPFWNAAYLRETAKPSFNWFRWTGKAIQISALILQRRTDMLKGKRLKFLQGLCSGKIISPWKLKHNCKMFITISSPFVFNKQQHDFGKPLTGR